MDMKENSIEFSTIDEVEEYIMGVPSEPKLIFDIFQKIDGKYLLRWQEQKYYVAQDGQTYPDEVWITKEGKSVQVQDLDVEHLRNVLRMIIRNDRKYEESLKELLHEKMVGKDDDLESYNPPKNDITYH